MDTQTAQESAKRSAASWPPSQAEKPQSQEARRRLIATAAYLRAEQRRFTGGDPVADWLAAEAEVDQELAAQRREKERELAAFDKMYNEVRRALEDIREKVSSDAIKDAIEKASSALRQAGEYTGETVSKVTEAVKKDLASTAGQLAPKWETYSGEAAGLFEAWRGRSTAFLGRAARATGDWLKEIGSQLEHRTYRAGEMAGAGAFECTACGERQVLPQPNHLTACPKCHNSEFRRG
jgi:hypothetical protein